MRHCVSRIPERPERLKNKVFLRTMEPQPCVWYYARKDGNTVVHTDIRRARRDLQRGAGPGLGVAPTRPAYLLPGVAAPLRARRCRPGGPERGAPLRACPGDRGRRSWFGLDEQCLIT